ncbi:MAG: trypsin-like peptidase domain-containing protein [Schumannella sp.]
MTEPTETTPTPEAEQHHTAEATAPSAPTTPSPRAKLAAGPLAAALAVGAVLGGASGAGVAALAINASPSVQSTEQTPQTITIHDTDDVNVVTAVAAKASPSVVTVSVAAQSAGGTGSGVVLSADGYVLTNNHVVTLDGTTSDGKIEVTTSDGRLYTATIVGTDPIVDLAVIKLDDASGLQPIEFADSSDLNVGDQVIAIGAPLGLSNTVTDGIVSALNRSIQIASSAVPDDTAEQDGGSGNGEQGNGEGGPFDFWNFGQGQGSPTTQSASISLPVVQTDAAINPGNSGGALVNTQGELIGINVAIASAGNSGNGGQSGSIGVGFAIPSNLAQRVANEIIKNGSATHGLLGATVRDASSDDGDTVGALVDSTTAGGAAATAGVKPGDIITGFNGLPITGSTDLTAQVRALAAGDSTTLTYVRGGTSTTIDVTLGTLE